LKIGEDLPNKTYIDTSTSKSKIMTYTVKNMIDHTKTSNLTKIYPIKPRYSHLKIKNKTKTVKKRDQPCLNFKFDQDLPDKTKVLPPQNQK
jgi:hypothetical protein